MWYLDWILEEYFSLNCSILVIENKLMSPKNIWIQYVILQQ